MISLNIMLFSMVILCHVCLKGLSAFEQLLHISGELNKFPDFFVQAFTGWRLLKIQYVIAIPLMR